MLSKDDVGRALFLVVDFGEITNSKDHEKGSTHMFVALTAVSQSPSIDFAVDDVCHVVD